MKFICTEQEKIRKVLRVTFLLACIFPKTKLALHMKYDVIFVDWACNV